MTIFSMAMFTNPIRLYSCDDFFVDELLDLSNKDGFVKEEEEKDKSFVSNHENSNTKTTTFTANKDKESGSMLGSASGSARRTRC